MKSPQPQKTEKQEEDESYVGEELHDSNMVDIRIYCQEKLQINLMQRNKDKDTNASNN